MDKLIELKNIKKVFPIEKGMFNTSGSVLAVDNVSFSLQPGEIVSLVGESGSGKSTVGRIIQGLIPPTEGELFFQGEKASLFARKRRAHFVQTIFQDPFSSLNPKLSVGFTLREALEHSNSGDTFKSFGDTLLNSGELSKVSPKLTPELEIRKLLDATGLPPQAVNSYPHQFSGGQKQRIGIARALAMRPKLIVADEPVSSLDLSIQAQILNLLIDINKRFGISILLITHDLAVVEYCSNRVLVMKQGRIVEVGSVDEIFKSPKETYTQTLLSSMLTLN